MYRDLIRHWNRWRSSRARRKDAPLGPFGHSFALRHLDSGSCNACELELQALSGPHYDAARFGIDFVASPRHADALLLTGPITRNLAEAVGMTVEATPAPKLVIACGDCACGRGPFAGSYAVVTSPESVVHADVEIPGCPPNPQQLLDALAQASGQVAS